MNIKEAKEKIDELEKSIEEKDQEIGELQSDNEDQLIDLSQYHELDDFDKESFAEKCFNAGFDAKDNNETKLKGWLNYKVGERI